MAYLLYRRYANVVLFFLYSAQQSFAERAGCVKNVRLCGDLYFNPSRFMRGITDEKRVAIQHYRGRGGDADLVEFSRALSSAFSISARFFAPPDRGDPRPVLPEAFFASFPGLSVYPA